MSKNQAAAAVQTTEVLESPNGSAQVQQLGRPKNGPRKPTESPHASGKPAEAKPGRAKTPGPEMSSKMSRAMDQFMGGKGPKPKEPPEDDLPPGVDDKTDPPELEDDAEPTAKKAREEIDDPQTGAQKVAALRNRDNAKKAPKAEDEGETDDAEVDTGVPENDTEEAETDTNDPVSDTPANTLTPAQKRALEDYNKRFGLNIPLDMAARARDSHLDQFAQIVDGQANGMPPGGQPAGPAAGGSQGGQPHQASGQPLTSHRTPGQGQQAPLDDKLISAIDEAIGGDPVFAPVGKVIQGLQAQVQEARQALQEMHTWRQQDLQERGQKLLSDFWAKKVNAGFHTQLGTQKSGINQVQQQVRVVIVQKAAAYSQAMRQQGNPVTPDEALELSFQHVFRDQQAAMQQNAGRQELAKQVVNRHRQTSLPGGPGQRNGATSTSQALSSAMDSFLGANKRR